MAVEAHRNVELKARLVDREAARRTATRLATSERVELQQRDTYFHCNSGRLKLREFGDGEAQLIAYRRPDTADTACSRYHLVEVPQPELLRIALADTLGVRVVVEKQREVYLHHHVRIHIDQVRGLGDFLEFEAVLQPSAELVEGDEILSKLKAEFGIDDRDLVATSYAELVSSAGD